MIKRSSSVTMHLSGHTYFDLMINKLARVYLYVYMDIQRWAYTMIAIDFCNMNQINITLDGV